MTHDFKNPILDKYLELKKSIDYKTVFPTDLQDFVDSLDNTEREGLENDLQEKVMENFIIAKADGTATVLFEPTATELGNIGYADPFELEEDFRYHLESNFPGMLGFVDIDTNSRFMNVFCENEEIAEVVNEELNHLIGYREAMVDQAMNFEGGLNMDQINEAIEEIEKTLAKLKNLLV